MKRRLHKFLLALFLLCALSPLSACGKKTNAPARDETKTEEALPPREAPAPEPEPTPEILQNEAPQTGARYVRVLANALNVRAGAGAAFPVLGQAECGTLLAYTGKVGDWYETLYCGKKAFVSADIRYSECVKLETGDEKTEKIIAEGTRLIGVPYVYGAVRAHDGTGRQNAGFSESAFDCSSLMQYIFLRGGVLLDVTTRTQILQGKSIPPAEIRRGDLLFFTNAARYANKGLERVGHVALYLGDGYLLHTASDYAKIEKISEKRKSYFLEARRMF